MPTYNKDYHTTVSGGLAPVPAAQARHHSYQLLSRLYLTGITREILPTVEAVPELGGYLPKPFDLDEAAAAHYQLFGFNVFPYESIFLDASGLLGGRATEAVVRTYNRFSLQIDSGGHGPDHIGQELAVMSFLCLAEAEALANGTRETAVALQQQQITFLQHHLLRWLCPFVQAVKTQQDEFYTAVAELTLALIYDHYQSLTSEPFFEEWPLPEPPDLLRNDKTGLKEIASFFVIPAYSGIFLSRDDIGRLARGLALPRGFGERRQLLTNLMHTAVQYDRFSALMAALATAVADWQQAYRSQSEAWPLLKPFVQPWQERATQTINMIRAVRKTAVSTTAN